MSTVSNWESVIRKIDEQLQIRNDPKITYIYDGEFLEQFRDHLSLYNIDKWAYSDLPTNIREDAGIIVIGAGGVGSLVVGTLREYLRKSENKFKLFVIVDDDTWELSNLLRVFPLDVSRSNSNGKYKAVTLASQIEDKVKSYAIYLEKFENVADIIISQVNAFKGDTYIFSCASNFIDRYLYQRQSEFKPGTQIMSVSSDGHRVYVRDLEQVYDNEISINFYEQKIDPRKLFAHAHEVFREIWQKIFGV